MDQETREILRRAEDRAAKELTRPKSPEEARRYEEIEAEVKRNAGAYSDKIQRGQALAAKQLRDVAYFG